MFAISHNIKNNKTEICTKQLFDEAIHSPHVAENCKRIREVIAQLPDNATDEAISKAIEPYKIGSSERHIESLPYATFHAHFKDGIRKNENAVASGLVSLDLDHVHDPRSMFDNLKELCEPDLALAFVTPSNRGLKLVFKLPADAHSIAEAQDLLVKKLGVDGYFDSKTSDLARAAFLPEAKYFLYRNDEVLFSEDLSVPADFGRSQMPNAQEFAAVVKEEENAVVPENVADKEYFDGVSFNEIIEKLMISICGQSIPKPGNRNNSLYELVVKVRLIDDDESLIRRVVPTYGLSAPEWSATIRSAMKARLSESARRAVNNMVYEMRREKAIENGQHIYSLPQPPELKHLPPVIREFVRVAPRGYESAFIISLMPMLGALCHVKANANGPDEEVLYRTTSFLTIISGEPASGKGFIGRLFNRVMGPQLAISQQQMPKVYKYLKSRKQSDMPVPAPRILPERISQTALNMMLEMGGGRHLMLYTPELSMLLGSNGRGSYNDLSSIMRKATDNDVNGQLYMSTESHATNVPVYLNMLMLGQPEVVREFFSGQNDINGLNTRVAIVELPDTLGCEPPKMKRLTPFEEKTIKDKIEEISNLGIVKEPAEYDADGNMTKEAVVERREVNLPLLRRSLNKWAARHRNHSIEVQVNPAEEMFSRRARDIGFCAGMLCYCLSGMHETQDVIATAEYVAEYVLQSQLLMFGPSYNARREKRIKDDTEQKIIVNKMNRCSLLRELPEDFTADDIRSVKKKHGFAEGNIYQSISYWTRKNYIVEITPPGASRKVWHITGEHLKTSA